MDPVFTEEQLNRMSREDMLSLLKIMQEHRQKQEETLQKQESRIQILEEKTKELEFLNAMLSDRLTLAQRKRFGASSEKYADGYTQLNLFNEAEQRGRAGSRSECPGTGPGRGPSVFLQEEKTVRQKGGRPFLL